MCPYPADDAYTAWRYHKTCAQKRQFLTRTAAQAWVQTFVASGHYTPRPGYCLRVYVCPFCACYHYGHTQGMEALTL